MPLPALVFWSYVSLHSMDWNMPSSERPWSCHWWTVMDLAEYEWEPNHLTLCELCSYPVIFSFFFCFINCWILGWENAWMHRGKKICTLQSCFVYHSTPHSTSPTFQQLNTGVHFEDLVYHSTLHYIVLISGKPHSHKTSRYWLAWHSRVQTFRVSASWNWIAICTHKNAGNFIVA